MADLIPITIKEQVVLCVAGNLRCQVKSPIVAETCYHFPSQVPKRVEVEGQLSWVPLPNRQRCSGLGQVSSWWSILLLGFRVNSSEAEKEHQNQNLCAALMGSQLAFLCLLYFPSVSPFCRSRGDLKGAFQTSPQVTLVLLVGGEGWGSHFENYWLT